MPPILFFFSQLEEAAVIALEQRSAAAISCVASAATGPQHQQLQQRLSQALTDPSLRP